MTFNEKLALERADALGSAEELESLWDLVQAPRRQRMLLYLAHCYRQVAALCDAMGKESEAMPGDDPEIGE